MRNERGCYQTQRETARGVRGAPLRYSNTLPAVVLHRALNTMTDSLTLPAWLMQFSGLSDVGQVGGILKMLGAYAPHVKMANLASPHVIAINLSEQDRGHATHRLAIALLFAGLEDMAESLLREAVHIMQPEVGDSHTSTLAAKQTLAVLLARTKRPKEAEPLFRECLAEYRLELGEEHPDTLGAKNNLAELLKSTGRGTEAEPIFREALGAYRRVLGSHHPDTLGAMNNLSVLLEQQGRSQEVVPLQREASGVYNEVLGATHPSTLGAQGKLVELLEESGQKKEAEKVRTNLRSSMTQRRTSETPLSRSASLLSTASSMVKKSLDLSTPMAKLTKSLASSKNEDSRAKHSMTILSETAMDDGPEEPSRGLNTGRLPPLNRSILLDD